MALFGKVVEVVSGATSLEKVHHRRWALRVYSVTEHLVCSWFLFVVRNMIFQLPPLEPHLKINISLSCFGHGILPQQPNITSTHRISEPHPIVKSCAFSYPLATFNCQGGLFLEPDCPYKALFVLAHLLFC